MVELSCTYLMVGGIRAGIIQDDCELPAKQQRAYKESEREWKASKNPIQCEGNESAFQNMATHLRLG